MSKHLMLPKYKISWGFVSLWAIATAIFGALGFASGYFYDQWIAVGIIVGVAQGITSLLWWRRSLSLWWAVATSLGWIASVLIITSVNQLQDVASMDPDSSAISVWWNGILFGGLTVGVAQWLVLRREYKRAALWFLATPIGYGISAFFGPLIAFVTSGLSTVISENSFPFFSGGFVGLILGTISGLVLRLLSIQNSIVTASPPAHTPSQPPHSTSPS